MTLATACLMAGWGLAALSPHVLFEEVACDEVSSLEVRSTDPSEVADRVSMTLTRVQQGSQSFPTRRAGCRLSGPEARYDLGHGITEWYKPHDKGVEHGISIDRRFASHTESPLILHHQVIGATVLGVTATGVTIEPSHQKGRLAIGQLHVVDATDRAVPSRFIPSPEGYALEVDDRDAQYPITVDPLLWIAQEPLRSPNLSTSERFSLALSLTDTHAFIGAQDGNYLGYRLERNTLGWTFAEVIASDDSGYLVTIASSNDTLLVTLSPHGIDSEAVAWLNIGPTSTTYADRLDSTSGELGRAIALDGTRALVSDFDRVLVVERSATLKWNVTAEIPGPTPGQRYACATALAGNTAVIIACDRESAGDVYTESQGQWTQSQQLDVDSSLGWLTPTVALNDSHLLVGLPHLGPKGTLTSFRKFAGQWVERQRLIATPEPTNGHLGTSLSLDGDTLVVGDSYYENERGIAYVFSYQNGRWEQTQLLEPPQSFPNQSFGATVALKGDRLMVGCEHCQGHGLVMNYAWALPNGDTCDSPTDCGSGVCNNGICCDSECTSPCASCHVPTSLGHCAPQPEYSLGACHGFLCDGIQLECPTSCAGDAACSPEHYCDPAGKCASRHQLGHNCSRDGECVMGHCSRGICCDRPCDGSCEACDSTGACVTSARGLPGNPTCTPYVCDGTSNTCSSDCGTELPCAPGFLCVSGQCHVGLHEGQACETGSQCATGHCTDSVCCLQSSCGSFRCGPDGACRERCDSNTDCSSPNECDSSGRCLAPTSDTNTKDSTCAASSHQHNARSSARLLFGLFASMLFWTRRRLRGSTARGFNCRHQHLTR